jgi:hypothetical protein
MKAGPSTEDLIALAGETLTREVLPALAGAPRYAALMVVSALAIARREGARRPEARLAASGHLRMLLHETAPNGCWSPERSDTELEQDLCRLIRMGAFDGSPLAERLMGYLDAANRDALHDVNPSLSGC